ncbi:MAG: caspase family protein [Smithellaceae bacterium]
MKAKFFFINLMTIFTLSIIIYGNAAVAQEKSEIFVQLGHSGVNSIVFSPDGKQALSGGDKTVKLWDVETGREIRTFTGHVAYVSSVSLSPDQRHAISGGMDRKIILWDLSTGRLVKTFTGHKSGVFSVAFAPDGRTFVSGSQDKTLKLWDMQTGREIRTFSGHQNVVRSVAFSPDGRVIASGSWDGSILLWDSATGREIKTLRGHDKGINSVSFAPDGKHIISGSSDNTVKIWNVAAGTQSQLFTGHVGQVNSVAFSANGKYALSGGQDKTLRLWDINKGTQLISLAVYEPVFSVAFSSDNKHVLSGSRNMKLWDMIAGKEVRPLEGKVNWVLSAAFSADGKYALSGFTNGMINLWEITSGRQVNTFRGHTAQVTALSFSPDGKYFLSAGFDGPIKLWETKTGKEIRQMAGLKTAVFSPDGRFILSGAANNTLKLWETETGREAGTFPGHADKITSVAISADGKIALSGSHDKSVRLWDLKTGKELRTFTGHRYPVSAVAFSPDGEYAAAGSGDGIIKLWQVSTGLEIKTIKSTPVNSLTFSPDGILLLSCGFANSPSIIDVSTGKSIASLAGHALTVYAGVFSPDGKYIITGSGDGTARIWNTASGRQIAQFIGFIDGEWIVITPEGYYNSSANGHKYLNIRVDNSVYGIDQFYDVFYRPDIVMAKLRSENIAPLITLTIDEAIQNPPPTVEFTSPPQDTTRPVVKACYRVVSTGGGVGEVRLFHNGKLIQSDGFYKDLAKNSSVDTRLTALNGKAIYDEMRSIAIKETSHQGPALSKQRGNMFEECQEFEAVPGENEVSLSAFNGSNTVQSYLKTATFHTRLPKSEPRLYILAIGINKYRDASINLKYAVKDAADIKEKLLRQSATLFKMQNISAELLQDNDATKKNITDRINKLVRIIKPADSFILFVAGHGVLLENQYYMLTSDFNGHVNENSLISSNEIVEISKKIKSLSQLFIFDTCHAGGVDYIVSGLYDARMSVLAKKMGLHIYASANSIQAAVDGYKGNGLFTYTLLDGLNNNKKADKNKDGNISVVGLGDYSRKMTTDISTHIGHSQTPLIINFGKDYPLYRLR